MENTEQNPDLQLGVEFFTKAVENPQKSAKEGRPIFDDREFVRIRFPADNKRELVAPAHEMHYVSHAREQMTYARRFAASYDAFQNEVEAFVTGTPIALLPGITESRKAELKALNVVTIEQLAGLPDASLRRIGMGARALVEQAQVFLESSQGNAEVEDLKRQIAEMRAQLNPAPSDPFAGLEDEDLKNMIRDAGAEVPKGRASRATLVAKLQDIAAAKEDA